MSSTTRYRFSQPPDMNGYQAFPQRMLKKEMSVYRVVASERRSNVIAYSETLLG